MALIENGMVCPLCNNPIDDLSKCLATTMVNLSGPLSVLDDAAAHSDCVADWPLKEEFVAAYNEAYGSPVLEIRPNGHVEWQAKFQPAFLPADSNGRIACMLSGLLFGSIGYTWLSLFVVRPRKILDAPIFFECSLIASLFGTCLILWALFRPDWVRRATDHIVKHLAWLLVILFIPFAARVIITLLNGIV